MTLGTKLRELYFDLVYNPVYDFTTAQLTCYQRLQKLCIDKLEFEDNGRTLCVGVGTGNEILRVLDKNAAISVYGVDTSQRALDRAYRKALNRCCEVNVLRMDAHRLNFEDESFDKVLCIHVMGFLTDDSKATKEIIRVLKNGGQFVITYPSGSGGLGLVGEIKRSIVNDLRSKKYGKALKQFRALILGSVVYLPGVCWVKPQHGFYSYHSLKMIFDAQKLAYYQIEEDRNYQDFIVYGKK